MTTKRRLARRVAAAGALAGILAGVFVGCTRGGPPAEEPRPEPTKEPTRGGRSLCINPTEVEIECLEAQTLQQDLAALAIAAMRAYGRIDPGLYDRKSKDELQRGKKVKVRDEKALRDFDRALTKLNGSERGRKALVSGYEDATKACGGKCPATSYDIEVKPLEDESGQGELYTFVVLGDPEPKPPAYDAFLRLYHRDAAPECKGYLPALQLGAADPADDPQGKLGALDPAGETMARPQGKVLADGRSGTAMLVTCLNHQQPTCEMCPKSWVNGYPVPGLWKKMSYGGVHSWCCRSRC